MQATFSPANSRVQSIDLLRGLVMIIMALDHVRDYFHADSFLFDPLDLGKTNGAIYFTRWITHFCAPVFMFLAGTSAAFMARRKTKKELAWFLFTRGIWLIFLELIVVNFGWNFDVLFTNIYFVTIWALGVSMIVLALL
ncbi:MAG TPA: heparan-alpha-glucosaminide N-acetyltransferase domain-containing protein, partial [Ferruginibacter sp.]|nr:heparan-alpha-glucosaminide N-acetyltransferase domain-containing protein [Ferruginibacter sp.]